MSPLRFRSRLLPVACAAMALLAASCDLDEIGAPVEVASVGLSAPATTVEAEATLQLTATVSPSGAPQGVSWTSSDPTVASVSQAGLVTGIWPGEVTITATSAANPAHAATVDLMVTGCGVLQPAMVLNGASLPAHTCYRVRSPLVVSGGTLAVAEGVLFEAAPEGYFTIGTGGRLNVLGTADDPVTFTSIDPAGTWRGILFDGSRSADNVLAYAVIENGGSTGWSGAAYSRSAVMLQNNALVAIQHSTIRGSAGQGITLLGGSEMTFENNTLADNAVAAWVHPDAAQYIGASTTFEGNTANVVRLAFSNNDRVLTAQTWQALAVPFEVRERFFVEAALSLAPGAILEFTADRSVIVQNGGSLHAAGTADDAIVFRSVEPGVVFWQGLQIRTASASNVFQRVRFEDGGSTLWTGGGESRATVYLDGNSRAVFTDCVFAGSARYGLWVPAGGDIPDFTGNVFTGNERTIIVHPNRAGAIAADNTFSGNVDDRVRVTFSNNDAVTTAQTWHNFGAPFYVNDRTFVQAALTVAAGTTIEFAQDARVVVNNGGSLEAAGSEGAVVAFRGGEDLAGYWMGIEYTTVSAGNALTHTTIRNAGSGAWTGGANSTASLHVTASGAVALANVDFAASGGFAVIIRSGGSITCTDVDDGGFEFYDYASGQALSTCP